MKAISIFAVSCALALVCVAQKARGSAADADHAPAAVASARATGPQAGGGTDELEKVLVRMDQTSAGFKNAQADFVWDQYDRVVEAHDRQSGSIYFRRNGSKLEMGADFSKPTPKKVVYSDDKVQIYEPKIDQLTIYSTGKKKGEFESFLVLGFGGRGHDLAKDFQVTFAGTETVDGVRADKLKLVPKTEKARNVFKEIYLWIDPASGLSVRQKFIEPSDNYRDAMYTNIRLNKDVPKEAFKVPKAAHVVTPQQ